MNCERIQELVLTDYLDGQLTPAQKQHIDGHLHECPQCRAFVQAAHQTAFEPFLHAEQLKPSESVWQTIQESIEAENAKINIFENLWEKLKSLTLVPNPAVVLATVVTFLAVGGMIQDKIHQQASAKESSEYLESLSDMPNAFVADGRGFVTTVEQYFL